MVANFSFHIEHIISQQHGGSDNLNNLAYACSHCNWKKGPNISTVLSENGPIIPLYNPRTSNWADHFALQGGVIQYKTSIGEGTIRLLEFNAIERILERIELIEAGIYP